MLGKNIKKLREKLGLSQEELAQKIGMHSNTIARWERDEVDPRGTSMWKLAKALNVSSATLLTGDENISEIEANNTLGMDMHGITISSSELRTDADTDDKINADRALKKPENFEQLKEFNNKNFFAGRSGHLYYPTPERGIAFWGTVLDAADFAAANADIRELSRIEPLLKDAYETIANAIKTCK